MKPNYTINERQKHRFGLNLNYIVVFNWERLNEIDMMGTEDLRTTYMPSNHTVAVFKIKWK